MPRFHLHQTGRLVAGIAICLAAGCATGPKGGTGKYVLFPPPPDEPRIQFLTGFAWESDLGGQSKLSEYVLGRDRLLRPVWKPYGITATPGMWYVCDTAPANVSLIDLVKRRIRYFKPSGSGALQLPINIAVDDDGTRYVTDTKRCQLLIYGADGSFQAALGRKGEMKPCGVALTKDRLYVTDLSNHCVRVYGKANRELLFLVPRDPNDEEAKLRSPTNVAVDQDGNLYVSDTGGFTVQIYDAEGKHIRNVGELGIGLGQFNLPKGIGVDREGRLYVVDAATGAIQLFDKEGRLLMFFGNPGASGEGATYLPAGLTLDYDNLSEFQDLVAPGFALEYLILVTNQAGTKKVSVYGFLRKQ